MQTLRKRNSPSKYKNEPARFLGDGMTFKAKLIGILEVNEARGDKMCQDALNDLKTAIRAAGEHKQRITISIAIDGLRLRDEKTGDSMYHHPVHKISFIAQDMSDSRAFGYIFGSPDTGHRFFGIKTDKTASQVVIAMRDLFQVVFELKKKEIEMTKRNIELHQNQYTGHATADHSTKDDGESKSKASDYSKTSSSSSREAASAQTNKTGQNSEAIADLLDLEDELNSIQQGISQMDRITPSDPFGPLTAKGESFLDSFREKTPDAIRPLSTSRRTISQSSTKDSDADRSASHFGSGASTSSRAIFFPQYSPNTTKACSSDDPNWFDQESDTIFKDATSQEPESAASPVTFHTPTGDPEPSSVMEEKRSPLKTDFFTDLDPLGTGKVKPYLDKKDFFQELKNPPKKVLKELITEPSQPESSYYFPTDFKAPNKESSNSSIAVESTVIKNSVGNISMSLMESLTKDTGKYSRIDPFEDMDPFEKTDPFLEESFPKSIGFPSLTSAKASVDVLQERVSQRPQMTKSPEDRFFDSPSKSNAFSSSIHGPLRVSLPPEKPDTNTTISLSSLASRLRSSPSPTEDTKIRRKHYQALRYSQEDKSDDQSNSPILEEVYMKGSPKPLHISSIEKKISIGSPPPARSEKVKAKISASLELLDSTPDPPPRPKTTLFAIKPPPLPPKKQNQPTFRPPARPPSLEENIHYDFLRQKYDSSDKFDQTKSNEGSPKKVAKSVDVSKKSLLDNFTNFPILPRPPQRKTSVDSCHRTNSLKSPSISEPSPEVKESSVLNITLNQLDQSGLENLASTLGIPTENVCNMTLQELTKMLAQKYLGSAKSDAESENIETTSFQADFDSNFGDKIDSDKYDKYAVFKELLDEDPINSDKKFEKESFDESEAFPLNDASADKESKIQSKDCGDRYAALRQLSITAQKSDNLSEDLDISYEEDSSAKADNISDIIKQPTDESCTPLHSSEIAGESPVARMEPLDDIEEVVTEQIIIDEPEDWNNPRVYKVELETVESISKEVVKDSFETMNDNWATFEKDIIVTHNERKQDANQNENSPISSDGKEEDTTQSAWKKPKSKGKTPWKDDDESGDDCSAKESYWSDESSHDGQSPVKENKPSYHRKVWNKHTKPGKVPPVYSEVTTLNRQRRRVYDTDDEYDDPIHGRRAPHQTTFELERKKEGYTERGGSWGRGSRETDRYSKSYSERRKHQTDYRRRCDSDASDKECMNAERCYADPGGKLMQYYGLGRESAERHRCDNRESRSKYKRATGHKRPSSASDAKRYEKMYSPMGHSPLSPDKRESDEEEYSQRFRPSRKDLRYHSNIEHYGSYDRRMQATHRRIQRGRRPNDPDNSFSSETRHFFPPETPASTHSEDTPEPVKELHFRFEDDFIPSPTEQFSAPSRRKLSEKADKKTHDQEWDHKFSKKDSIPLGDNNNENFGHFDDDFEQSPKLPKDKGKIEGGGMIKKPSLKGRSHLAMLSRQDSNASLRKSESINIFSRESDPFEDDEFFSSGNSGGDGKLSRFYTEKSKSNTNVSDPFAWKDMFGDQRFED